MREVVVIGAGIVGISLAHALARRSDVRVTVLERDATEPRGSTAYAPGFVGLYNDMPILTDLACESATVYDSAHAGFYRSGGLELATSAKAVAELQRRVQAAELAGLRATLLSVSQLPQAVSAFVDTAQVEAAAHFADDGSADIHSLAHALRQDAISSGARFLYGREVTGIAEAGAQVIITTAADERFVADHAVLATGVWGPTLGRLTGLELPLFPVAHPYVYDAPGSSWVPGPFVRWPERHVYSRIHKDRLGIGTYDHHPVSVDQRELIHGAKLAWMEKFTAAILTAQGLLRPQARFTPKRQVNGVFAMTPDNLPFLGRHPAMQNIWVAQALWVTHAAGAAVRLVDAMLNGAELPHELRVNRFETADMAGLRDNALHLYRDIYTNDAV